MSDINQLVAEVEAAIDGPDVRIVRIRPGGYSGWEAVIEVACGKTIGDVIKTYCGTPAPPVAEQMKDILPFIRAMEARRLAEEEALMSTVARFYV